MPRASISKINGEMCAHEVSIHLSGHLFNWNRVTSQLEKRLKDMAADGDTPTWGNPGAIAAIMCVSLMQSASVHWMMMQDEEPEVFESAQELLNSFRLSDELSDCIADFVCASDEIKAALIRKLKAEVGGLPWEVN